MGVNKAAYEKLMGEMQKSGATLIAVSKTKPSADIMELYALGHRDFGENYVQELVKKQAELPEDIRWHFIGHLQSNKIKMIGPYVHLIHGVDSIKLLEAIDKEGRKLNKKINCLLQVHVAKEETKFGLDLVEARQAAAMYFIEKKYPNVGLCGIMGMASFSEDEALLKQEFGALKTLYDEIKSLYGTDAADFNTLSMGMSGDYPIALASGSNMIRVGSLLFGARN
jgi:pyridoxal phosphate enzyme (YggS family)